MVQPLDEILNIFISYGINFNIISTYISKGVDSHTEKTNTFYDITVKNLIQIIFPNEDKKNFF